MSSLLMREIIFTINNPRIPSHAYDAPSSPLSTVDYKQRKLKISSLKSLTLSKC